MARCRGAELNAIMLGLYLHVPFCRAICSYCNFNRGLFDAALKAKYVSALEREIRDAGDGRDADTIFFGGGTPSLLEPAEIAALIRACRASYALAPGAEVTLETNPETATPEKLAAFREAGVNRISFGVQSFDAGELQRLDRIHTADRAEQAVRDARGAGFDNLSFDLMFWLPGQSKDTWRATVDRAIALAPDHLSLYLLELYPNSPLKETMARQATGDGLQRAGTPAARSPQPTAWEQSSDDDAADMYLDALSRLDAAGFEQYEISNVARPGFSSRHNVKYWQGGSWRGFGCGAHSTVDGRRWKNVAATGDYVERIGRAAAVALDVEDLSAQSQIEEALFTGLRLNAGIDRGNFQARYGVEPWSAYEQALAPYVAEGLMWVKKDTFGLTRRGMLVANDILATFV